ncbi:MAG TPA: putative sulfate exporter family transporter [Candidatus Limnocylindrales bacterium]|nr:putative sulfate exporter family transporter [Candidatus Limnocylindrales bacterium]
MARDAAAGLLACLAIAAVARIAGSELRLGLETALALVIGLALGGVVALRGRLIPGATLASRYALRVGITLLGARLTLGQLLATGADSILAIVLVVSIALLLGTWLARRLGLVPPLSALVTVGMAICGNSAILALSPIIGAKHRDTAYAVSTITIFGLIGVLLLPVVGRLLALPDPVFGTWAGLAVNDTAQVVATGYAFSPSAGDAATVVKLTRNLAILPVLLGATWLAARSERVSDDATPRPGPSRLGLVSRAVPWFVIGFVVVAGLRSVGLLDARLPVVGTLADLCSLLASILILVALAGVGLATDLRSLAAVGPRPFVLGASMWLAIGLLGLILAGFVAGLYPI